jgi:UDP-N-acetylmuramate dehydrogenase
LNIEEIYDGLSLRIDKNRMKINAPMKEYTSFKAGGSAALLIEPQSTEELAFALKLLDENEVGHMVIGNGSNLLVRDHGYQGVILRISGREFQECRVDGQRLIVGAGVLLSSVSRAACEASLAGFEFASGIPGTIGGAVFMNAGAYDGEISHIVESAVILAKDGSRVFTMNKEDLELTYRHSILQDTGDILLKAVFLLKEGEKEIISERIRELTARRTEKQPLSYPSAGSFFKRPQGHFAGKLIQDAGLRGLAVGGAQVSPLHSGFIINTGGATATNIIDLMEIIRSTVFEESGVLLEPEVRIIGD